MKTRIIGFGNPILGDDAVGLHVARGALKRIRSVGANVDVIESAVAGFALLDLMNGWDRVILIDAVQLANQEPGDVVRLDADRPQLSLRLCSVHEADLPTLIEIGPKLGYAIPKQIVMFGIQAQDLCTFGEQLSEPVAQAVSSAIEQVLIEANVV